MTDAMCCALVDFGDERNPCRYNKWVMGEKAAMRHASSAADLEIISAYVHRHPQAKPLVAFDAFAQRF